ncbi:bifunctional riboflavin kinase/FMN phosphatase-like [Papaver somniferum]|uniref:bifunctional riboflavin kinase/FMN phosphatase-like n=1 Tax=Papaver somniferum TaxID=3469 RepID=UPI000E6F682C|nr:bifunctional riboflavin kinase/FMN phosphatase-like [Papaver somniferum]
MSFCNFHHREHEDDEEYDGEYDDIAETPPVLAVIMDLDGTLLNTEKATKGILNDFLKKYGKEVDREKEDNKLGMMHSESTAATVKDYDLPLTPEEFSKEIMALLIQRWPLAQALPGANRLIQHLHKQGIPFALASNSRTENVQKKVFNQQGWKESFSVIIGSDQVKSGKPSPDIFLEAAKRMGVDAANCLVIEDSVVGVMAGKAAGMKVVAVPSLQTQPDRYSIADSVLHSLLEFQPELWGLPAFEDWVRKALPIEPMYVQGLLQKGSLCEDTEDGPDALPDQVSGVYFGWARLSSNQIVKTVISVTWHQNTAKRVIRPHLIDEPDECISGQLLQILIVGYIREPSNKVNSPVHLEITEQNISTYSV